MLALNGELDFQVDPDQNLPEIQRVMREAGNPDVTIQRLPGLNHLFQEANTGKLEEHAAIEETMNPSALNSIRDWILERFGPS